MRQYVQYIIEKEWQNPTNRKIRFEIQNAMDKVWNSYYEVGNLDEKSKLWYEQSISKLDDLMNARLAREFSAWEHLDAMMWSLLIIGGVITICFMFFFGLENIRMQMLMTALLSGYISFMLYLVFSLDNIYRGPYGLKPVALEQVQTLFHRWDKESS